MDRSWHVHEPADRKRAEWAVRSAMESAGRQTHSMVFILVQSPMAGVLASTYLGFGLEAPMKDRMTKPLNDVLGRDVPGAKSVRRDIGNYTWHQVWQTIGDPLHSQG